ncbi:MAG: AbrB/MazE/SpoVT family DNA-binding domain-containing protein [Colwellia sp.]|nr:AbrB/MazE/SpoVT family DNA-binding domain-containing protein [Colwellia sp.]
MQVTTVTSKGQVTIPLEIRQQIGVCQGSKIEFTIVGDHVELRVNESYQPVKSSGFGMLKSKRAAVPHDFDTASLFKQDDFNNDRA